MRGKGERVVEIMKKEQKNFEDFFPFMYVTKILDLAWCFEKLDT